MASKNDSKPTNKPFVPSGNKSSGGSKTKSSRSSTTTTKKSKSSSSSTNIGKMTKADVATIAATPTIEAARVEPVREITGEQIDRAQQEQFRAMQMALAQRLEAQSRGEGPSLAELQMQRSTERNLAAQMAMARSGRSGQGALGMRTAAMESGRLQQDAALASALARIQEQQQAQALLGQVTDLGRLRDIGLATSQAELNQGATLANQKAFNDALIQNAINQNTVNVNNAELLNKTNIAQAGLQQGANTDYANALNQRLFNQANINSQIKQQQIQAGAQLGSANIAAGAQRYGVDADLYKFNMGQMLGLDQRAFNNTTGIIEDQRNIQTGINTTRRNQQQSDFGRMNQVGSSFGMGGTSTVQ